MRWYYRVLVDLKKGMDTNESASHSTEVLRMIDDC